MIKRFLVGGSVRDLALGIAPNDYDYAVEGCQSFQDLIDYVQSLGYLPVNNSGTNSGFVEFPHTLTLKARNPSTKDVEDFACTRREFDYRDRKHPSKCEIGTLIEDLGRRDLGVNAIAFDPVTRSYIDPFSGLDDINNKILRAVGDPFLRFSENPERVIRVIRFHLTLDFSIDYKIQEAFRNKKIIELVSKEVDDCKVKSLNKILKTKSHYTKLFTLLHNFPELTDAIFSNIGLIASNKNLFAN